jgi:methyl-accepting chemotaxis protein
MSGGKVDERLEDQFKDITQTILENQNEALGNLTTKVEKEIGQVWRQMGIMYSKVSNSIDILEKVKSQTENYVNNTGKNLGTMEGQVEGLTDRVADVDTSLNYMVGQLSLVVQEFNQVKTNLADGISQLGGELDEIREYKPSNNPNESNNQEDK